MNKNIASTSKGSNASLSKSFNNYANNVDLLLDLLYDGDLSDISDIEDDNKTESDNNGNNISNIDHIVSPKKKIRIGSDRLDRNDELLEETIDDIDADIPNEVELIHEYDSVTESESPNNDNSGPNQRPNAYDIGNKKNVKWRHRSFDKFSEDEWKGLDLSEVEELLSPLSYFHRYIPDELLILMTEMTNIYALQQGRTSFKPTNLNEMKTLVALHIATAIYKLPRLQMYWNTSLKCPLFTENMSRDRFFELRNNLHLVNNLAVPKDCNDKFFKVRPLYDFIRKRCLQLQVEKVLSVDEAMVPFTGKMVSKQYVKNKPNPWGIKIFMLCGKSGMCYDFIIYQGSTTELPQDNLKAFGLGSSVVLKLAERFSSGIGHELYFDNFFSSYNLLYILQQMKNMAAGTVRINRFFQPPLITDKEALTKGRGSSYEISSAHNIVLVKWIDSKCVVTGSNFIGAGNIDQVERWDKSVKRYVKVDRPEIIKKYNYGMGGVDLFDQCISYYRIFIRSKKWPLRLIFHGIDMAVLQGWNEYKRDATVLGVNPKKMFDLLEFRIRVMDGLIKVGRDVQVKKRGRPSNIASPSTLIQRRHGEKRPLQEVQFDGVGHLPQHDSGVLPSRCKYPKCTGRSRISCIKCNIHLCLTKNKNCFLNYHTK